MVPAATTFLRRALLMAMAAATLDAACYSPAILDGGYRCAAVTQKCPDGFSCDTATMTCRRQAAGNGDAAVDRGGDTVAATDGRSDATEVCTTPAVTGCTPVGTGLCDLLCQTGCGCDQKCSSNTAGTLTCNAPLPGGRMVGQNCDIQAPGAASQTDNCVAGAVCVQDSCNGRCYRFCRTDQDCPNSTCTRDAGGGVKICDVPTVACNPIAGQASGCPTTAQACYVSATITDRTLCDCPFGSQGAGATCTVSRDCLPGLTCADATGTGDFRCRRTCTLQGGMGGGCNNGLTCRSQNGSRTYGFCF